MEQGQDPDQEYELRVLAVAHEGEQLLERGDVPGAIGCLREACALVREADVGSANELDPTRPIQQLGSMLYVLSEWEMHGGEPAAAIDSLNGAEETYRRLLLLDDPLEGFEDVPQRIADVMIRRARAHEMAGHLLSAITDAQQAVMWCMVLLYGDHDDDQGHDDDEAERRLDAARVVGHAAGVQLAIGGDPDLAVAGADWAVREYLAAFQIGDEIDLPAEQVAAAQNAAIVAAVVHTAFGREELAGTGKLLGSAATQAPFGPSLRLTSAVGKAPTLAKVLGGMDRDDLADTLTAPCLATDVRLFVPADRSDPEMVATHAEALVGLQMAADDDLARHLLGLEAHALFAAGSQWQAPSMRDELGYFGQLWATAVLVWGQHAGVSLPAALDAARWLRGIITALLPHALVDAGARSTSLDCLRWQLDIFAEAGDTESVEDVSQMLMTLDNR